MQVLLAGGAGEVCSGVNTPASNKSYLVNVTPGANHSIVEEDMAFPRLVCLFVWVSCTQETSLVGLPTFVVSARAARLIVGESL